MLSRFHLVPEHNGQTDRQICYINIARAIKKRLKITVKYVRFSSFSIDIFPHEKSNNCYHHTCSCVPKYTKTAFPAGGAQSTPLHSPQLN